MPEQTQGDCRNDAGREGGCGLAATGLARGPTRRRCHAWWRPKGSKNTAGSHHPGPQSRTDKRRKVDDANANSRRWSSMGFTGQAGDSHPSVQGGGGDGGGGGGGGEGGGGGGGGDSGGFSHGSSSAGEGSSSRGGNSAGGGRDTDGLSDGRGARGATAGVGQVAGVRIVIPITVEWDPTSACW